LACEELNIREELFMSEQKKSVTIFVEGTAHEWPKDEEITYAQIVAFEYPDFEQQPGINYTVSYERGHGNKPEGTLPQGASVKVKEGMIFHVTDSGQS
jgi:hypothetical protein